MVTRKQVQKDLKDYKDSKENPWRSRKNRFTETNTWNRLIACVIKLRKMFVFQKRTFMKWCFDVVAFLVAAVVAVLNIFIFDNNIIAIVVCVVNLYYLYRFSIIGWYSTEHYYSHINVYNRKITMTNGEVRYLKKSIYGTSTSFIVLVIVLSFLNSLVLTSQLVYFFDAKYHVLVEIGGVIVNILLIPSFIKLFETMIERRRTFYGTLNNAFVKQSEAMINLFEKYEFKTNYVSAVFPEYGLKTRHNIFWVDGSHYSPEDKKIIEEGNHELMKYFAELWKDYEEVIVIMRELAVAGGRVPWRRLRGLTMHYFKIWETFFELG
jgi:hypothetical protein